MVPTAGSRWSSSAPRTAVSAGSASPVAWRGGFPDRRRLARERAMTGVASVGGCRRFLPLSRPFAPFTAPLARRPRTDEQQVLELGEARRPLIKRRPGLTVRRRRRQSPLQVVVRRLDDDVHQIDGVEGGVGCGTETACTASMTIATRTAVVCAIISSKRASGVLHA